MAGGEKLLYWNGPLIFVHLAVCTAAFLSNRFLVRVTARK
jgi:hypothetical protein